MDLKEAKEEKIAAGHQIIVIGDFNSKYDYLQNWMIDLVLLNLVATNVEGVPRHMNGSRIHP